MKEYALLILTLAAVALIPPLYWMGLYLHRRDLAREMFDFPPVLVRLACILDLWRKGKNPSLQRIDPELTPEKVLRSLVYAFEHGPLKIQTVRPILDLFVLQALETRNPTATLEDAVAYLKKLIHDLEYYTETQEIIKEANRETAPGQITNPENPDNCSENPNNFSDCHNCRYFVLNESKCLIHYDTALEAKQISAGLAGECRDWKPFERTAEEKNEHEPKSTLATIAVFPDCHTCRYYLPWSQVSKCLIDKDTECGKTGNCPKWKIQIENQKLDRPPELFSSRL